MGGERATDETPNRVDVSSADGTSLAVWVEGEGPPLVLVHGSPSDHVTFDPLVDEVRSRLTTFAMDRRGSGASGDSPEYAIEREFEDVAAVVDAIAARTGQSVALYGHSYGAGCAMGGAARSDHVHRLLLYEPTLGLAYPAGSIEAVDQALAAGDRDAAIRLMLVRIVGLTEDDFQALRSSPRWPRFLAVAPSLPRECRAEEGWVYRPGQFEEITAPTLVLTGSLTSPTLVEMVQRAAAAIPGAQIRVLGGEDHLAHRTHPAIVAAIIEEFISS